MLFPSLYAEGKKLGEGGGVERGDLLLEREARSAGGREIHVRVTIVGEKGKTGALPTWKPPKDHTTGRKEEGESINKNDL